MKRIGVILLLMSLIIPNLWADNQPTVSSTNTKMIIQPKPLMTLEEKAVQIIPLDETHGEIIASLVDEDGLVYLFTNRGYAIILNNNGQIMSAIQTGLTLKDQQIMFSRNGSMYLSNGQKTTLLFKDGGERWTHEQPFVHFAQSHDGTTLLLSQDGRLMATDINGEHLWEVNLEESFSNGLCVGINKTIITLSDNGNVYLVNDSGETVLKQQTPMNPSTTPIVDITGDIYYGTGDSKLIKRSPAGEKVWEVQTAGTVIDQPVFDFSGNVIYATTGGIVCSVKKATGEQNWQFYTDGGIPTGLTLSQNKVLYFTTTKNKAYALSTEATLKWKAQAAAFLHLPPILKDKDTLIIPAKNKVYLIKENTGGIAKSAWVCLHGNQQRRQSLYTPTLHRLSTVPYDPVPLNGETKTQRTVTFKWELDMETTVDFYLGTQFPLTRCGINIKDNTITIPNLSPNTVYYWRVEPRTEMPNQAIPNWTFRTGN